MIHLYTASTPNGWKASIALEELGLDYTVHAVDLSANQQKTPEFLAINPNGKIPAIIDDAGPAGPITIFESGAILIYLAERTGRLWPADPAGRYAVLQWMMFQVGGLGPMMGQAGVFLRYAPEKIPFAIDRYQREVARLLSVLDGRLAVSQYLAGDDFSIADIMNFPWASTHDFVGVGIEGLPNLQRWIDQIATRPSVVKGLGIPAKVDLANLSEAELEARRSNLT